MTSRPTFLAPRLPGTEGVGRAICSGGSYKWTGAAVATETRVPAPGAALAGAPTAPALPLGTRSQARLGLLRAFLGQHLHYQSLYWLKCDLAGAWLSVRQETLPGWADSQHCLSGQAPPRATPTGGGKVREPPPELLRWRGGGCGHGGEDACREAWASGRGGGVSPEPCWVGGPRTLCAACCPFPCLDLGYFQNQQRLSLQKAGRRVWGSPSWDHPGSHVRFGWVGAGQEEVRGDFRKPGDAAPPHSEVPLGVPQPGPTRVRAEGATPGAWVSRECWVGRRVPGEVPHTPGAPGKAGSEPQSWQCGLPVSPRPSPVPCGPPPRVTGTLTGLLPRRGSSPKAGLGLRSLCRPRRVLGTCMLVQPVPRPCLSWVPPCPDSRPVESLQPRMLPPHSRAGKAEAREWPAQRAPQGTAGLCRGVHTAGRGGGAAPGGVAAEEPGSGSARWVTADEPHRLDTD